MHSNNLPAIWILVLGSILFVNSCTSSEREDNTNIPLYTAEELVKSLYIAGPDFSTDGTKILYSSDQLGNPGVWVYDSKTDKRTPIIYDSVKANYALDMYGEADNVIYISNKDGSQFTGIFVKEEDEIIDVTEGLEVRALYRGMKADRSGFYYTANKRSPREFDLFEYIFESKSSAPVFTNDTEFSMGKVSSDHRYILMHDSKTEEITDLYVNDLITGKMTRISPGNNKSLYRGNSFSGDDNLIYYLTNDNSEFTYVATYNIASGERTVYWEEDWDIVSITVSDDESLMAVNVNINGSPTVKLIEMDTKKELAVPFFDKHQVTKVVFSPDGKSVGMRVTGYDHPRQIWMLNLETFESELIISSLNPAIDPEHFSKPEDVTLTSSDGLEIPAYVYHPKRTSDSPSPALVWTHGGPGGQFLKTYDEYIQFMVNNGYTVIAVNNRGSSGYGKTFKSLDNKKHGIDDMKDILAAKEYLESLSSVDQDRIGIIGASYGGYLSLAALTFHPDEFDAGVDMFGISNWLHVLNNIPTFWETRRDALYEEMGHPVKDSLMLRNKSPLFFSEQIQKPLLVIQGENDPRVPKSEADQIVAKVRENEIPVEYLLFDDEGHGIRKDENKIEAMNHILTFFNEYLK